MSYINIQGRGLKFNQGALIIFKSTVDLNNVEATSIYALIYAGLKMNAFAKREEFADTFEQACDWTDTLTPAEQIDVVKCFSETQAYKNLVPEETKEVSEEIKKNETESTESIVTGSPGS